MNSLAQLSELLALLYSAPLEPDCWHRFINGVCHATGARLGALISVDRIMARIDSGGGDGYDESMLEVYNSNFYNFDPYREPAFHRPRVGVVHSDEYLPRRYLRCSDFYNGFFLPFGLECSTIATFTATPSRLEVFSLVTSREGEEVIAASKPLIEALLPHLHTACSLRRVLAEQSVRAVRAEAALDRVAVAALLLNAAGEVHHQNYAASALLRGEQELGVRDGRLRFRDSTRQSQLDSLIAHAAQVSGAIAEPPGGAMLLPRRGKQALQVRVLPLRTEGVLGLSPACVLVLITDPEQATAHPAELLRLLYGFTASEAQIANQLCAGLTPDRIAELRHVSLGTVRVQIKQLMHKAGVRRQAELVRLMLTLPTTITGTATVTPGLCP